MFFNLRGPKLAARKPDVAGNISRPPLKALPGGHLVCHLHWILSRLTREAARETGLFKFNVALVHRDHKDYKGRGAKDGHLDFRTALELCDCSMLL